MLPAATAWRPAAVSRSAVSRVTVDLPLLPVTATVRAPCSARYSWVPLVTWTPRVSSATTSGRYRLTPGESTTTSPSQADPAATTGTSAAPAARTGTGGSPAPLAAASGGPGRRGARGGPRREDWDRRFAVHDGDDVGGAGVHRRPRGRPALPADAPDGDPAAREVPSSHGAIAASEAESAESAALRAASACV